MQLMDCYYWKCKSEGKVIIKFDFERIGLLPKDKIHFYCRLHAERILKDNPTITKIVTASDL